MRQQIGKPIRHFSYQNLSLCALWLKLDKTPIEKVIKGDLK
jgi:hypothetical protein